MFCISDLSLGGTINGTSAMRGYKEGVTSLKELEIAFSGIRQFS